MTLEAHDNPEEEADFVVGAALKAAGEKAKELGRVNLRVIVMVELQTDDRHENCFSVGANYDESCEPQSQEALIKDMCSTMTAHAVMGYKTLGLDLQMIATPKNQG